MATNYFSKISKFFLYLVPLAVIIVYQSSIFPFIVGKYTFFRSSMIIALALMVWAWATSEFRLSEFRNAFRSPLVLAVSIFVFVFAIAGFLGYNPWISFWSNYERGEGVFQLLALFAFFLLLTLLFRDAASWRRIFKVSLWAAILMIAYGVAAALHLENFIGGSFCERFSGSLGNPAYTGTYLIFSMFYAAYLLTEERKKMGKLWWLGLIVIFFIFLILTQTRGALLGFGVGALVGLIYLFLRLPKGGLRWVVLGLICLSVLTGALAYTYRDSIKLVPFCKADNAILKVSFSAHSFQTRLWLWQKSYEAFKERPLLGWGPENFASAFERQFDNPAETAWFDRAHSIYFDYLVFSGSLGLLSFLSIFVIFLWWFFKKTRINADEKRIYTDKNNKSVSIRQNPYQSAAQNGLIFAMLFAYLIQGLVLFDVLPIYINLFLFLAFANWKFNGESQIANRKS